MIEMKNRIRELRLEKGLRQKDVAEMLGISTQSFCNYENWVNKPDPEMLIRLADIFEVSIDYLLCRADDYGIISPRTPSQFTEDEEDLIAHYRRLSSPMKIVANNTLEAWSKTDISDKK